MRAVIELGQSLTCHKTGKTFISAKDGHTFNYAMDNDGIMIELDKATAGWEKTSDGWLIAPAGLDWIEEGCWLKVGTGCTLGDECRLGHWCTLGNECTLGNGCTLGRNASDPIDIGFADGYRKCIAEVDGAAYIGAGCRWFTVTKAIKHWSGKPDRVLTMCLMAAARQIATTKGWRIE